MITKDQTDNMLTKINWLLCIDAYNQTVGGVSPTLTCSATDYDHVPVVAYGLISKGNGETILTEEKHMSLSCGGQAGQGYPCVMVIGGKY